jgi:protein SDA1
MMVRPKKNKERLR